MKPMGNINITVVEIKTIEITDTETPQDWAKRNIHAPKKQNSYMSLQTFVKRLHV